MTESLTIRLDQAIVQRGLLKSRAQAQAAIDAGHVLVDGVVGKRSSQKVELTNAIVVSHIPPFVSRGGIKLAAALDAFAVDPCGMTCLDVGASTGGFTDCLLQRGARSVTAIDVGFGQLDERIARDPRVIAREHVNARYLSVSDDPVLAGPFDLVVVDVSFISQTLLFGSLAPLFPSGQMITLIKPQFEVGRDGIGPGGIVKTDRLRLEAISAITKAGEAAGLTRHSLIDSPIAGGDGNIEYLAHFVRS